MYTHPDAQLRFIVDARGFHKELPGGEAERFGEAGAAWGFTYNLAVFDAVMFRHAAGDVCRCAGWDALYGSEIRREFAIIGFA
jgi:hypothetical protein